MIVGEHPFKKGDRIRWRGKCGVVMECADLVSACVEEREFVVDKLALDDGSLIYNAWTEDLEHVTNGLDQMLELLP